MCSKQESHSVSQGTKVCFEFQRQMPHRLHQTHPTKMFDELLWQASTLQINDQKEFSLCLSGRGYIFFWLWESEGLRNPANHSTSPFIHNASPRLVSFLHSLSAAFHKFKQNRQHVCALLLLQYDGHQVIRNCLWIGVVGGKSLRFVVKFALNS
jgi:hypothetical protein